MGSLPRCFRDYPGVVLQLARDGCIVDSNGVLDAELGSELRGRSLGDLVDDGSSREKVGRLLETLQGGRAAIGSWELVLDGVETLPEPRSFAALRDAEDDLLWLVEERADPRLGDLRERVEGVNAELASTQRELLKERIRLTRAMQQLEEQYQTTAALALTVQQQNDALELRNSSLQALTGELRRSNEALDEFAHVVSHDLKAPLRSIANHASWLSEDLGDAASDEHRRHVERVLDRVERMRLMIQGILDYARAGRDRARAERVEVDRLVEAAVQLVDPPAGTRVEIQPGLPVLHTEWIPLQQVFVNLIANAVRHGCAADPWIGIGWSEAPGGPSFTVADNGPGVPAEIRDRIWNLFHSGAREAGLEGTGIGLAVVRKLVESRGGTIGVDSREGGGALFHFTWPN